jgi:cytochrome b subunit of formate dehydrogenase
LVYEIAKAIQTFFVKYGMTSDASLASLLVSGIIALLSILELLLRPALLILLCSTLIAGVIEFVWVILPFLAQVTMIQIIRRVKSIVPATRSANRSTER